MNLSKTKHALELLGTSPSEVWDRAVKTEALKLSKNFIKAFEISGKLPPERIKILREEHEEFKAKLAEEDEWFRGEDGESEETTDPQGKVVGMGDEKTMKTEDARKIGQEIVKGMQEQKDFEEATLDVVDTGRSPQTTYSSDLYDDLPDERPSNTSLTEANTLGSLTREGGITHENQRAEDIYEYHSPEAQWNKRRLELKTAGKPTKIKKDEDDLLSVLTR